MKPELTDEQLQAIYDGSFKVVKTERASETYFEMTMKEDKEKPVNEACLFKPVMVWDSEESDKLERIFLGIYKDLYVVHNNGAGEFFSYYTWRFAKRIPGYDYGDNDE